MIRAKIDLTDCPAWEMEPCPFGVDETHVHLGHLYPGSIIVQPALTLIVDKDSADKARQIGALLIAAAELHDPTGLELVRAPGTLPTSALDSLEGGSRGTPTDDAGEPAGAAESPVSPERTTPTQGAAVQSLTREGPEESDLDYARRTLRRFG